MATLDEKIAALAKFKGVSPEQITFTGSDPDYPDKWDEFEVDGETYTVMDGYEADEALKEDVENFIDDVGITGFAPNFAEWIKSNALDSDWFEDACRESDEFYAQDIANESGDAYATRLIDECVDANIITTDDIDENGEYTGDLNLEEEYAEYLTNRTDSDYAGDFVQWYIDNFGDRELATLLQEGRVSYDLDAIVDEVKSWDGYGNNLARYDGYENEEDGLYIFRQS